MLRRKIDNQLLEWKDNPHRKPIVIKGGLHYLCN